TRTGDRQESDLGNRLVAGNAGSVHASAPPSRAPSAVAALAAGKATPRSLMPPALEARHFPPRPACASYRTAACSIEPLPSRSTWRLDAAAGRARPITIASMNLRAFGI